MYCIYHSRDLDGWMSAAIVRKYLMDNKIETDFTAIGWDYGDPIPVLEPGRRVYMVDVSFPIEEMIKIGKLSEGEFVWIDHHISSIKDFLAYDGPSYCKAVLPTIHDSGDIEKIGACELVWNHLFPEVTMPTIVEWLGAYDSFRHKMQSKEYEDNVVYFQYACRAIIDHPINAFNYLENAIEFNGIYDKLINRGRDIKQYLDADAKLIAKTSRPVTFGNVVLSTVSANRFNPKNFNISLPGDGTMCYWHDGTKWHYSVYSDYFDCAAFCKERGGGGHKGAAGFTSKILINELM